MTTILDLPELPLAHILSFLDVESLEQAQMVAFPFHSAARNFRSLMAKTKILLIEIRTVCHWNRGMAHPKQKECYLQVKISKTKQHCIQGGKTAKFVHFPVGMKNMKDVIDVYDDPPVLEIYEETTFSEWFTANCKHMEIAHIYLKQVDFDECDIAYLKKYFVRKTSRATEVNVFIYPVYDKEHVDRLLRFADVFAPLNFIPRFAYTGSQLLLTDHFFKMLPTLEKFLCPRPTHYSDMGRWTLDGGPRIPSDFYMFPPRCTIGSGIVLDISSITKGLHEWAQNRLRIKSWAFILPAEFQSERKMIAAIGLRIYRNKGHDGFFVRNCAGQELNIRGVYDGFNVPHHYYLSFWIFGDDPEEWD